MNKLILILALTTVTPTIFAQNKAAKPVPPVAAAQKQDDALMKIAESALAAHGGSKLKNMKSLVISGSVDITTSTINQAIPATFATIFAGDKYRIDINNPFTPFQQTFDGEQTYSSLRGNFTLPPLNRLGLPLLSRIGDANFTLTSLPEAKKKKKGFRLTAPDGFYTDFYLDEKTNLIKGYDSSYEIKGRSVTTSVEIDKYRSVEGIVVPEKYAQRFDTEAMIVYANFKSKDITVNQEVKDEIFVLKR